MSTWTAAELPSFAGKTVVVTGSNSGLGLVTARELARVGARVVLAVRDTARGDQAAATITGDVEVRRLDLQDLSSVTEFAEATPAVDVLINNAGIMAVPHSSTRDGFESQIGTNHLGHFALTNRLLPKITDRVVTVSSMLHQLGRIDLADLNWKTRSYSPWPAYGQSKLANLLFSTELQRRLAAAGSPVRALSAHPGYSRTNLQGHSASKLTNFFVTASGRVFGTDADFGARQTLFAASQDLPGDAFVGPMFHMWGPTTQVARSARARNKDTAAQLWELSEQLTGTTFPL